MRELDEAAVPTIDCAELRRVLQDSPVSVAVLYGSHARESATERSDVDVAVGFEQALDSLDRTRARLDLVDRLQSALGAGPVDVVPLSDAGESLLHEIRTDGILLVGSSEDLAAYGEPEAPTDSHEDRMATFDDILADLEQAV